MPYGFYVDGPAPEVAPKVGRPKRDRSKNKAARKARRRR